MAAASGWAVKRHRRRLGKAVTQYVKASGLSVLRIPTLNLPVRSRNKGKFLCPNSSLIFFGPTLAPWKANSPIVLGCVSKPLEVPWDVRCHFLQSSVLFQSRDGWRSSNSVQRPGRALSARPSGLLAPGGGIQSRKLASSGNPRGQIWFAFNIWVDKKVESRIKVWGGNKARGNENP